MFWKKAEPPKPEPKPTKPKPQVTTVAMTLVDSVQTWEGWAQEKNEWLRLWSHENYPKISVLVHSHNRYPGSIIIRSYTNKEEYTEIQGAFSYEERTSIEKAVKSRWETIAKRIAQEEIRKLVTKPPEPKNKHIIKLSNGCLFVVEEVLEENKIRIATGGTNTIRYLATLTEDGVVVMPNSGDATWLATRKESRCK